MTKRRLTFWVFTTLTLYSSSIVAGIAIRVMFPTANNPVYGTFKDLIPFFIAIPAAWLGHCFSRRLAFLQQLRSLWAQINTAIQASIQYTHAESPTQQSYGSVLTQMSTVIDELRGAFKNIGETQSNRGLYPFEEFKNIRDLISALGFGAQCTAKRARDCRRAILHKWKTVQEPFLGEFDREEPTYPSSPYLE